MGACMASLDLITTGAKLGWGVDEYLDRNKTWNLGLTCRLAPRKTLRLKTGEKPEDLEITVGFVCNDESRLHYEKQANDKLAQFAKEDGREERGDENYVKAVGVGAYFEARDDMFHPERASLHFTIYLPEDEHVRVIEHARNGQYPASIIIGMLGPQHGWEPDNSGVDWDNITWKNAIITSFAFDIPLPVKGDEPEPIFVHNDQPKPAATSVGADLLPTLSKLATWQTYSFWALVVLVLVSLGHR